MRKKNKSKEVDRSNAINMQAPGYCGATYLRERSFLSGQLQKEEEKLPASSGTSTPSPSLQEINRELRPRPGG